MKGRILFHKHNQELRTKSKALVFLFFFPFPLLSAPDIPSHKRTVKIIAPLVQPPTYRTINRHLTPC